ncbi:CMGC family protein kinase [Tritrichomonas foetus]|uniref:CMGC family protein kinase n=1 Tax=Tritrichomonas foetus TaxID=1144522 RepID=A0A1J4JWN1_9EUKA|nr:CMGC family protein kinase [Tritrichomonas foetus]|eukprot:OHT01685.1 CMGC family protein kinase [Tritrichomonas foetus]
MIQNAGNDRSSTLKLNSALAINSPGRKTHTNEILAAGARLSKEYSPIKVVGQGAFGIVYAARDSANEFVAIKKVMLDPRYKNRELEILNLIKIHPNCVSLKAHFLTAGRRHGDACLNLVMDYLPMSLHMFNVKFRKDRKYPPLFYVKLFGFQIFAGLNHLHSHGIMHRDIKPNNIIIDMDSGELKICDFGSAKKAKKEEKNISYVASRYFRAPELILDCSFYSTEVDIWAAGCTIAEILMASQPLFEGNTSMGQFYEIVKIMGKPTNEDLASFQHQTVPEIPDLEFTPLETVLPRHTPRDLLDLFLTIFKYNPQKRPTANQCMGHPFFDDIFDPEITMPDGSPLPPLSRTE